MKALVLGLTVISVAVLAVVPCGLGWLDDVLAFLRGSLPVFAVLTGIILVFMGITDIKERADRKKDGAQSEKMPNN